MPSHIKSSSKTKIGEWMTRLGHLGVRKLAGRPGFEPGLRGPEPRVLPLDDLPKQSVGEKGNPYVQSNSTTSFSCFC